ncbi:hypothetical protein BCV69DRAFT_148202 [Microstroma glucosiphilum]|uniref:Uncharacterized protein n=1 Tax=Pseudomicrostroma glucosiphilum TaxID=1684307 RepID=A0A316UHB3_9BASI|nr:hypothetical protein BCV69DRAFT_148202 [Pseudomicrostroma glucosiphilum]PWN22575.1 hypothetical protein BCV69DRAFT_148202 [Pseudomicrostroma glucosiphilum]
MAEVCKRFHNLSRSSSLQAHWFISTHGRAYALFYALARPRLFKRELLHKLLQLGAVFSLQLEGSAHPSFQFHRTTALGLTVCILSVSQRRCKTDGTPAQLDTWGQNLSHDASEAVFQEGEKQVSHTRARRAASFQTHGLRNCTRSASIPESYALACAVDRAMLRGLLETRSCHTTSSSSSSGSLGSSLFHYSRALA